MRRKSGWPPKKSGHKTKGIAKAPNTVDALLAGITDTKPEVVPTVTHV